MRKYSAVGEYEFLIQSLSPQMELNLLSDEMYLVSVSPILPLFPTGNLHRMGKRIASFIGLASRHLFHDCCTTLAPGFEFLLIDRMALMPFSRLLPCYHVRQRYLGAGFSKGSIT